MTKEEIIHRLLEEGHISPVEAAVLLKEVVIERVIEKIIPQQDFPDNPWIGPNITGPFAPPNPFEITGDEEMVPYGNICSCNPANGGSGICGCVMANKLVPKNSKTKTNWTTDTSISTNLKGCPNGPGACFCTGACKK